MGGFRCASGVSARFWAQVRPGGAGLGPGSPIPRWVYAAREFVPRVTTTGVCQAEDPTSPCCAATSPKGGMHSTREPLWGFDSCWSTKSLSHPRPSRCGVLGRSRQPNGSLSLTALCDRTATFPAGGIWIPGSECSPLQGTPSFFATPGMECGGSFVHGSGRRGYVDVGAVGYVFCFRQIVVSCLWRAGRVATRLYVVGGRFVVWLGKWGQDSRVRGNDGAGAGDSGARNGGWAPAFAGDSGARGGGRRRGGATDERPRWLLRRFCELKRRPPGR